MREIPDIALVADIRGVWSKGRDTRDKVIAEKRGEHEYIEADFKIRGHRRGFPINCRLPWR